METRIDQVTVFRDGARVTRRGVTPLLQGPQKVLVRGITELADEDSFRVKGKGPATLSTIDVRRRREVFDPEEDTKFLHEQLKKLELERRGVTDEIETFKHRLSNLARMMDKFADTFGMLYAADEADIEQLNVIDSKNDKLNEDTRKKLHNLEENLRKIDDQIQVIRSKIGNIESRRRIKSF
ncbi:MAG: DUF4140 domain-containing protein, partial [Candidatus Sifarchaeia archaeon]